MAGSRALVRHVHSLPPATESAAKSAATLRPADSVIACSQAVADRLPGLSPQVIYAGLDCASEPIPLDPGNGLLKLGVLSRLDPGKGIETVIEATARLALSGVDVETQIAGDGPPEFISSLHQLVARLGVSERVQFLGWRSDIELLFASWHLFLMPSLAEGFPLSALEAMMSARPIVASRVGGLCELVVDGVTGRLIPPQDTESLARCIAELSGDRQQLVQMGIAGRQRAQHEFSVERMAQRTCALYNRLLRRSSPNPVPSNSL
jgi:glycosyltransferase involved in cell wall biosynthesis